METQIDWRCGGWQDLYQEICSETDQDKLPGLVDRLEEALLRRQAALATGEELADDHAGAHTEERSAIALARKTLARIKTYELGVPDADSAEPDFVISMTRHNDRGPR